MICPSLTGRMMRMNNQQVKAVVEAILVAPVQDAMEGFAVSMAVELGHESLCELAMDDY